MDPLYINRYSNVTEADILLRPEFNALAAEFPERFQVHYVLDDPPAEWSGSSGYITSALLKTQIPNPKVKANKKIKVFVCGPPAQVKAVAGDKGPKGTQGEIGGALKELGFTAEQG